MAHLSRRSEAKTERSKEYIIVGDPVPLARPRLARDHIWDCQKQQKFAAGIQLSHQHGNQPLFTGPLTLDTTFYMRAPQRSKSSLYGTYHYIRCDLDNLLKMLLDVAQNIIFPNDCLIAQIHAKKIYDASPRTEFTVTELK